METLENVTPNRETSRN